MMLLFTIKNVAYKSSEKVWNDTFNRKIQII